MSSGTHPRNKLNDLSNRDFMRETKSVWITAGQQVPGMDAGSLALFGEWLRERVGDAQAEQALGQVVDSVMWSITPPRDRLKIQHPATFSEADVERLIRLFTKSGELVLDPFVGSGSTLVACRNAGRQGLGIELIARWAEIARQRIAGLPEGTEVCVREGDALQIAGELAEDSVDFIVTSPPYWSILGKPSGMKAKAERAGKGLATRYSDDPADLGNIADYTEFIGRVADILIRCGRALRHKRYLAVIVSDFRHGPRFYLYHADLARAVEAGGLPLKAITVLAQDNKNLYPFGIPHAFISNVHHQYILIFRKDATELQMG